VAVEGDVLVQLLPGPHGASLTLGTDS
jgi:hypothetical protein